MGETEDGGGASREREKKGAEDKISYLKQGEERRGLEKMTKEKQEG